jgi:uncharacterized repeat protein (TIGR01451 family)
MWVRVARSIARLATVFTVVALAGVSAAQAATVTLNVVSARTEPAALGGAGVTKGEAVNSFKYLINVDNTGTTEQRSPMTGTGCSPQDPGYPGSCNWVSIAGAKGASPVLTQGSTTSGTVSLNTCGTTLPAPTGCVPDGRYLVSVLADGYKLDGQHFTVAGGNVVIDGAPTVPANRVTVNLQPTPLPDATIQAAVFEDISPVNSAPDLPAEHGLAGFQGHITDTLGEVTTNVYGDPLCSKYDSGGTLIPGSGGRCLSACYVVSNGVDLGTVSPVDAAGRCPSPLDAGGLSMIGGGTAPAGSVIEGKVKIPNLGPNRYALSVTPPDGSGWVQTTTLEGNHDWDAWVMEGATGLDTEFIIAGEPFPAIIFGYTPAPGTPSAGGSPIATALNGTGTIKGLVEAVKIYVPTTGGVGGLPGEIWGGLQGAVLDKPIDKPWVTLTNLGGGDTIVWAGQGDENGKFTIHNVPAGTYTLTWWDEPQNYILDLVNVTVGAGETVDMGILPLAGWWTVLDGYVFDDANRNGVKDPGEQGLSGYTLTLRRRDNSLMDRGSTVVATDADGYYRFEAAYPMTQWLVMEAYDDLHYGTGVTYQADNQPTPTTVLGAGVDVSVLPIIGLSGRMDWGKHTYDASGNGVDPQNGGIVGTVSYDTTRNELDPRYAAVEDWQPSIPDLVVKLYEPVLAAPGCVRLLASGSNAAAATCDATGLYALDPETKAIQKGQLLNTYLTETWFRPGANGNGTGCIVRGADKNPVTTADQQFLPLDQANSECIEAPMTGVQFSPDAANVNGNYGFGDGCFAPNHLDPTAPPDAPVCLDAGNQDVGFTTLPGGRDYLVEVDLNSLVDLQGRPIYKVTREEDINIGNGDEFIPAVPPSACAGPLHVVDVAGILPDDPNATVNPTFLDLNPPGSPYEGQNKPLCDTKLVRLSNGSSIAPAFNIFTDVPLPGRHWFIAIDDLNFSSNPQSITYGEKAGMPFVPVGIYDWTNRLVTTVETDYNGLADVLLPSTNRINCPTPSGVCANLYRYVGNDPGVPGRLNLNYNPSYRTIAAEFEVVPGVMIPADLAPTQVGVTVQLPGAQTTSPVMCMLADTTPQLYAVSTPYVDISSGSSSSFTIYGKGFGLAREGPAKVTLDGTEIGTSSWSDNVIVASFANNLFSSGGPKQLNITARNGETTVNGLTFHVLKSNGNSSTQYNPQLYRVGPGLTGARTYQPAETLPAAADHAIQRALDDAASYVNGGSNRNALVVVYPNNPSANPRQNPRGAYYENLIISAKVKLQGVGPGSPDGTVRGSIIDGGAFAGDGPVAADWYTRISSTTSSPAMVNLDADGNATPLWGGNATIYDGAVISLYLRSSGNAAFPTSYDAKTAPSIDGFDLRGGNQQGFPNNINQIGGTPTGLPGGLVTQGGAIFANAYARQLQITNNVVQNNGGAYGTIRIGTPDLPAPDTDSQNRSVVIAYNRVIANAGTNQAGGIGLFNGSHNYQLRNNDICGNFSSEYGGGVSAVGYSPGGTINNNRIYFNRSFDEGGGIMIAGALPATTTSLSPGAGPVDIYNNRIQANLSNDDGGGIRFLMAGNFPMNVYNNVIVNNVSTHEGGGISINDAPNVRVFNNTIMKNLTTATAITSSGAPAPAGLSTSMNSALLQATLPGSSPQFSNPLLFNNIFWDNRAGTRAGSLVSGLSATDANHWDLGVADGPGSLAPTNSIVQQTAHPYTASGTNSTANPNVIAPIDIPVTFNTWRNNPAFLGAIMISADLPPTLMGNYHLSVTGSTCPATSPACNLGAASKTLPAYQGGGSRAAPTFDIDNEPRPLLGGYDAGADEYPGPLADLSIRKTNGVDSVAPGAAVSYSIVVTNSGTIDVNGAIVNDAVPATLSGATWTCTATPGSSCGTASGTGSISNRLVNLAPSGSATFTLNATVNANSGTVINTATVAAPAGVTDPIAGNNSSTDSDPVSIPLPTLALLDNFNRGNATNLGGNWSQPNNNIRLNNNNANENTGTTGFAYWNGTTAGGPTYGTNQGAAMTFVNGTIVGSGGNANSLILKATGGTATAPSSYIRVRLTSNSVVVETTTNSGGSFTNRGTLNNANSTFGNGTTLTAVANVDGSVDVWNGAAFVGRVTGTTFTDTGRIGMMLINNARVDNFSGGTLP